MIFRRLRERISRQDWLGVGIDFLILIVGVFLGLQAQDWNQSRLDRKTERDYLERLQGDFGTIVADLERDPMVRIDDYRLETLAQDRSFRALLTILRGAAANSYELCTRQRRFAGEAIELLTVSLDD